MTAPAQDRPPNWYPVLMRLFELDRRNLAMKLLAVVMYPTPEGRPDYLSAIYHQSAIMTNDRPMPDGTERGDIDEAVLARFREHLSPTRAT